MTILDELYALADAEDIQVLCWDLPAARCLAVQHDGGGCSIGIDPMYIDSYEEEAELLAHELGHCMTGSFYNIYATVDCRQRHENHADKWAIRALIPVEQLDEAIALGYTELWQLADFFGVTESFMRKAVCFYVHGNLASELYF